MNEEKMRILSAAALGRKAEVMNYQINIDNFRLAIKKIEAEHSDKPAMLEFADRLRDLLESSLTEQLKEIIMLEVIEQQLEGQ
jgi:dsDNA-binding SOS-regulon protein